MESFETKVERAKEILEALSQPEMSLENSVKLYKEGLERLKEAQKMLEEAKLVCEELNATEVKEGE